MQVEPAPAPRLPLSRGERAVVLALVLGVTALLGADLASGFNVNKLGAVFLLAFWLPVLALHALGHALAARLVGWRLVELGVGSGRELLRFRAGSLSVCVRTLPLEGYALVRPGSARHPRAKRALVYIGGPLANLALVGALAPALAWSLPLPEVGVATLALRSLAITAALGVLAALFPYRCAGNPSDGLALLECAFASDETLHERLAWPFVAEVRRLIAGEQLALAHALLDQGLAHLPDEQRLLGARAVLMAAEGNPQTAYAALEALGAPEDKPAALRAELIADAAWAVLLGRDEALFADALRAAGRASELRPRDPHYELLLGRAAFERRQHAAAYASLMSAYKRAHDADQELQCIAYLALACRALQQADTATPFGDYAARFEAALRGRPVPPGLRERVLGRRGPA